ncbi:inner centromere protein isoform X4 [Caretta caretta]|uniref:inner centromere protein isoform X4 n=1 Tax=Caretta caretta TaxID=8467 RepID=UPI00209537FC|nr:inner centromere protein isoform X4 [Caretta caretta]
MEAASGPAHLPAVCNRKLAEFLRQVDAIDMVWLREIREEAAKMFSGSCSDEPELMPKTPSQKNRPKRRLSSVQDENKDPIRKRLSRRSIKRASAKRCSRRLRSKEDLEIIRAVVEEASPPRRVTRSRAVVSDMRSVALPEKSAIQPVEGRVPLVDISVNDRNSAELHLKRSLPKTEAKVSKVIVLSSDDDSPKKAGTVELQPMSAVSVLLIPETTKPKGEREGRSASKLKIANTATRKATVNREPAAEEMEDNQGSVKELFQDLKDGTGTPTGSKSSRHSVRRSLMCRSSMSCRTSLAEKYSLASKRESMIRKSVSRTRSKRIAARQSSLASNCVIRHSSVESLMDEEKNVKVRSELGSTIPCKEGPQSPRMSLRSRNAKTAVGNLVQAEQQEGSGTESQSDKSDEAQEQPQSVRRKPSYKKAVDELYDGQQAEEGGLSPPRKKTPSPLCPASKVVRPFKTFLHTVQKNQLLMTPGSVGQSSKKKSFLKHNTPLRTDPKEKERQRLESLRKKQEAEQQRKQKLEEEKRQRLEEMKLKREARLRKVLQARERVEQLEEEKKRRIEQKLAQFDEKSEKVREERLAEEKVKKKVAAKKMGDVEARRRQEEEARKQKALQLEEEERRHKERMQKKREEEEQERAKKIAEQRQAEQEREKQLAAERELEKKKEQERIQAERERERQEKEKAARLQRELMAAREKERLQKEMEEKEKKREEQRLAELERQEQEKKATAAASNHLNVTVDVENSPVCNSYQMTPQGPKGPKPPTINPNNYGMDLNSDDSTDDESQPRKPIPAWANGTQLSQAVIHQYYNPPDVTMLFGAIISPKLENIFYKNKPRYFKRTSSAVWNSPPFPGAKAVLGLPYSLKKY